MLGTGYSSPSGPGNINMTGRLGGGGTAEDKWSQSHCVAETQINQEKTQNPDQHSCPEGWVNVCNYEALSVFIIGN